MRTRVICMALVVVSAMALAGCRSAANDGVRVRPESPATADENTAASSTTDAEATADSDKPIALPADFPPDVPLFAGEIIQVNSVPGLEERVVLGVVLATTASPEEVGKFYDQSLQVNWDDGFGSYASEVNGWSYAVDAHSNADEYKTLTVHVIAPGNSRLVNDGRTTIALIVAY